MDAEPLAMKVPDIGESSPVSIASMFKNDFQPEMQPLTLPGAWTVVGKGGRPLKNTKTYDLPKKPKKKKQKKSTPADVEFEPLADMVEMPSSSKCLDKVERAAAKQEKITMGGRDARHWARYRRAKQEKVFALDAMTAALGDDGMLGDVIEPGMMERPSMPRSMKPRSNKGDSHAEKMRRKARFASQAAKCYEPETSFERTAAIVISIQVLARQVKRNGQASPPKHGKGKYNGKDALEADAASKRWLPQMNKLKSMVESILEIDGGADAIEHFGDIKKRKDELTTSGKTGKRSRLWREGSVVGEARKSCVTM